VNHQKRVLLPVLAVVLAVVAAVSAVAAATSLPKKPALPKKPIKIGAKRHVNPVVTRRLRDTTWRWQVVMGLRRTHSVAPLNTRRALLYWRHHARDVRKVAAGSASIASRAAGATEAIRTGEACRWTAVLCAPMRHGCSCGAAGPTTGRRWSRCGSPSARIAAGEVTARGRTPPGTAGCSNLLA
jgi:hypothetical protein